MRIVRSHLQPALCVLACLVMQSSGFAASHREAPITALDQKADITDWYAFVSPEHPDKVIMILDVDPFLEPSNGPMYFPFDPNILYEMKVDNNNDGVEDVTFQFRFKTEVLIPGVFTGYVGGLLNIPPITALDGIGSEGIALRQSYIVTMVDQKNGKQTDLGNGQTLFAVPTNVGPRNMPNYALLRQKGVYSLADGIRVWAGTVADPFFADLGATFDSFNFRLGAGGGILPPTIDADDKHNYAPNGLAGFNVNTMVLEVPITLLTRDGKTHPASDKAAVIGTYGTTSRHRVRVLPNGSGNGPGTWAQVQRMGNPLINELLVGNGSKDRFSMDDPVNDSQFSSFFLSPVIALLFGIGGVPVPAPPRTDLLPLFQYMPPICPGCAAADAGPMADLLRLNTGIPPVALSQGKRLGLLAGDKAGFPNGRRPTDDAVDISVRAFAGILANPVAFGTPLGDGVNTNSAPVSDTFPFLPPAYDGRNSAHSGPGQPGCAQGNCPVN